ncbi:cell division protein FtsQ/DivIB [Hylemonella sp. W303a]|uniref:cell division protein FtsQ/DivIB n=1 Tax=Hylemonella sp. W303a TaxID=3389873 RepID=UPI00396AF08B
MKKKTTASSASTASAAAGPAVPASATFDVRLMNGLARALLVVFVLLALTYFARWVMQHPVFSISGLTVLGDVRHSNARTLRARVMPHIQGTFLTVDLSAVQRVFEAQPWVRRAVVQREFPNRLRVILEEHQPAAYWGQEQGTDQGAGAQALLNRQGEVFEANLDEVEAENLPRLDGPVARATEVLAMQREMEPLLVPQGLRTASLVLTPRGNWQLGVRQVAAAPRGRQQGVGSVALIELGGGEAPEVKARLQRFLDTAAQVAAHHRRDLTALEGADLRYAQGYALRLRGVSTVAALDKARTK